MPNAGVLVGGRVLQKSPGIQAVTKTVTLAQLNAGHVLVPAFGAVQFRVVNFVMLLNGTFLTSTDIRISDTAATPVDVATLAIAQAVDNAQLTPDSTGITLNAGWAAKLTAGKGIQLRQTGTAATGGTDILITVEYEVASGLSVGAAA